MSHEPDPTPRDDRPDGERAARRAEIEDAVERTVSALVDVGRLWAAHGLNVGRSALETSALTLRTTADLLGSLSERFAEEERAAERDERDDRAA
ncbi:MAG TPA: hypothetical protein RMH99_29015 [Sandaracinaceae bacterium LLY-WYZ-13_1]|nr:hypothetical protein [Sandaracinaceae bacterium LLY-WYZ-13_1]